MRTAMRIATSVLLLTMVGSAAAAESLPKKGTISGVYGWHVSTGQNIAVSQDHIIYGGVVSGPFVGDGGQGLLHSAAASCTFSGEFKKDTVTHNSGDCVTTDADGDKVTMHWKCTKCPESGDLVITSGTGKYAGIKGDGTFQQNGAGPGDSNSGWSVWKLMWERP